MTAVKCEDHRFPEVLFLVFFFLSYTILDQKKTRKKKRTVVDDLVRICPRSLQGLVHESAINLKQARCNFSPTTQRESIQGKPGEVYAVRLTSTPKRSQKTSASRFFDPLQNI